MTEDGEAGAQSRTSSHGWTTLRAWEERARIQLLDRKGAFFGRFDRHGILQRFHPLMDAEYELDLLSSRFPPDEEALWYARADGARFWSGSISHLRLVQEAEIRIHVPLAARWMAGLGYWHQDFLQAQRDLLRLEFAHLAGGGRVRVFLNGWLRARKEESDLEAGVTWRAGWGEGTLAILALDAFSDLVYQVLGVGPVLADTVLDYRRPPWALRTLWDLSPHPHWRLEVLGLIHPPSKIRVQRQREGFEVWEQEEAYSYGGLLLQWAGLPRSSLAAFVTYRLGNTSQPEALPDGIAGLRSPWRLKEWEGAVGAVALRELGSALRIRGQAAWERRREDRRQDGLRYLYRDQAWQSRLDLVLGGPGGFHGEAGLEARSLRQRGDLAVPSLESLEGGQRRFRLDLGWRFEKKASFLLGANFDLDQGGFDGGHGRFALYW